MLNEGGKIVTVGNPLDEETAFGDCWKPGSLYHTISVSTMESPNFTGEWAPDESA